MVDKSPVERFAITQAPAGELWGHPKGVYFLAMTEAWERFSFYGMRGLLILYLVQELLLPGHVENVIGMASFRPFVEGIFGPLSNQAFASQLFGLYAGFVYFTPLVGGWLADRWLGARKTVSLGILLMGIGHVLMVWEEFVLFALLMLILGSGCLKGNIAAQVGHLYPKEDEARRSRGFTIFSTGINIGAVIGPLVCGALAQVYGWHVGFGTAGAVMMIAAIAYFTGLRHFAPDRKSSDEAHPPLTGDDWRILGLVILILAIQMPWTLAWDQMFNVGMLWVTDHVMLETALVTVPVPWFASLDSLASILIVPVLLAIWRWQEGRGAPPTDLHKIGVGGAVMAVSHLMMLMGAMQAGADGKASVLFPLIAFTLSGISFMYVWPTVLALVSRRAPAAVNARMMAGAYLTAFFSGVGSGWLARFYEPLGPAGFWTAMMALSFSTTLLVLLFGRAIDRRLDRLDATAREQGAGTVAVSA